MEYGAIDLHLRRSVVEILDEQARRVVFRRIDTSRLGLDSVFAGRPRLRVLIESSTDSEWVAQHLETLGHEVVVADPNYAAMYAARSRKVKTDRRDVNALALACHRGLYRRAHRAAAATRQVRQRLRLRRQLVAMRTKTINLVRALVRQEGWRLPSGSAAHVVPHLDALPPALQAVLAPARATLALLTAQIAGLDAWVTAQAAADPVAQHLMTAPGVGPVLALTFHATLADPARFGGDAARASAFIGVVPREDSSAERQRKGHITKCGPGELRTLLVQASWVIWRSRRADAAALRDWAGALAARRGRRIAIVALARRLTRILYAMWRDQRPYVGRRPVSAAA